MQKITPCLWFDNQAEEAMNYYISIFPDAKIKDTMRPGPDTPIITGTFEIFGQEFMVLNGGPEFNFTEAVSFFVKCENQEEVDYYWNKLTADGGEESMCGWLKDKFGLSWQIVPNQLGEILSDPDPAKAQRAMQAMLQMRKIDIQKLEDARNQNS